MLNKSVLLRLNLMALSSAALMLVACQSANKASLANAGSDNGIVNGTVAQESDVGRQGLAESVVLVYTKVTSKSGALCTGTLIAPQIVLTAGHCLPAGTDVGDIKVGLHFLNIDTKPRPADASMYKAKAFVVNPDFLKPQPLSTGDLAMILLASPVPTGTRIADLPRANFDVNALSEVMAIGYGQADEKYSATQAEKGAGILRYTTFAQGKFQALSSDPKIIPDMQNMIAAMADTTSVCHGDSGGPLMAVANGTSQNLLVGVNDEVHPAYQGAQQADFVAAEEIGTAASMNAFYAKYPDADICSGGLNLFVNVANQLPWILATQQSLLSQL